MRLFRLLAASLAVLAIVCCAHPISVTPSPAALDRNASMSSKMPASVGYYISPTAIATEVTTAGGGGDNVRYFPYRDIEAGLQKVLSNVFVTVVKLGSVGDNTDGKRNLVDFTLTPELVTTSGESGFFTWPPTSFTVDLATNVRDAEGKLLTSIRVVGSGSAETSERLPEHGIAGRRAMEDALLKLQASLLESKVFTTKADATAPQPKKDAPSTASSRLAEIKALRDSGQITQEEYETKRKSILDSL
jgi:Short C-terminal domain